MTFESRMWIDNCGKCNGRWAGHVQPAYSSAQEYIRTDIVSEMLLAEREAGRRDRDHDIARLCNEIEALEVKCGLRIV